MEKVEEKRENLQEYYGKILQGSKDLKTNACCPVDSTLSPDIRNIISLIDDEILTRFYGCGSPLPPDLEGRVVLDLGCGTGKDVYIMSYLVGSEGLVIGVDMTDEQLAVAEKYIEIQAKKFGLSKPNVVFKNGFIEDLKALGIEDNSVDVVISNCVINLSPDKQSVFSEIFRVLKDGGELYFSDIFAGSRIPLELQDDPVLYGECLAGALYVEDFRRLMRDTGCLDYRIVNSKRISIDNCELENKIGMIDFYSMTIRAFKLSNLEDICEDYGQVATYLGTIKEYPHTFNLDDHHCFIKGKPMLVCGNTAAMLGETRLTRHFRVEGDRNIHYGPFDCGNREAYDIGKESDTGSCC